MIGNDVNRVFDFKEDDPELLIFGGVPEDLFKAIHALPEWSQRALDISQLAILSWTTDLIANPEANMGLLEICELIQRIQVVQERKGYPTQLNVRGFYDRMEGVSMLIETRLYALVKGDI